MKLYILSCKRITKLGFIFILAFIVRLLYSKLEITSCPSFESMIINKIKMDDKCFINYVAQNLVDHPMSGPYYSEREGKIETDPMNSFMNEFTSPWIEALLILERMFPRVGYEGSRTFVECGALDGLTFSTTLHLEYHLGWTGLLIEADPINYKQLKQLKRKAISINACASPYTYPIMVKFFPSQQRQIEFGSKKGSRGIAKEADTDYNPGNGKVILANDTAKKTSLFDVLCLPMYTMLAASNLLSIDIFVLDIEGLELDVLKTLPLEMLNIKVFLVETYNGNHKLENFKTFFENSGYAFHGLFTGGMHPDDAIFVKKNFYNPEKLNATVVDFYKIVTGDWTLSKFNEEALSLLKNYH